MRVLRPITIDSGDLAQTSSNVPETPPSAYAGGTTYAIEDRVSVVTGYTHAVYESLQSANTGHTPASSPTWWLFLANTYAVYAGGTTYADGDLVISTTTHRVYESLQNANTGNALTDTAWWLDIGPTNQRALYDQSNTTQTTVGEEMRVSVQATGRVDGIALLNVVAAEITVVMETVADGEFYRETFSLISDSGITNWYEYFFEPVVRRGDFTLFDLPAYADPEVSIIVSEPEGTAAVGVFVVGQARDLGALLYGARTGIQDYSRKETDDFGNFTIVERAYAKRASFKILVANTRVDALTAIIASYRAEAVVWIGSDDFAATWVYGFYRDFAFEIAMMDQSYLTLELEGLT